MKKKWLVGALALGLILGFWGGQQYAKWQMATQEVTVVSGEPSLEAGIVEAPKEVTIAIHVAGAVEKPGIYQLTQGQRVEDALVLAKVLPEALVDEYLNRAALLSDGEKILVPSAADLSISSGGPISPAPFSGGINQGKGLVNINQAELKDLTNLPGIGDVKGQAIIDYRQANGRFGTIEELKKVNGIGDKTYDGLKDQVSV